jgi:hypothetical protein
MRQARLDRTQRFNYHIVYIRLNGSNIMPTIRQMLHSRLQCPFMRHTFRCLSLRLDKIRVGFVNCVVGQMHEHFVHVPLCGCPILLCGKSC